MKLNEILLAIFALIIFVFKSITFSEQPSVDVISTNTNYTINYTYDGKIINDNLCEIFADTPLIQDGNINIDYFLACDNVVNEQFELSYIDLASLVEKTALSLSTIDIKSEITKIEVFGTGNHAKIKLNVEIDIKKQNFLTKLAGLKGSKVNAVFCFDTDIEKKNVQVTFNAEGIKITPFLMKIACKYIFNTNDWESFIQNASNKLFWGIGKASEFKKEGIVYN